MGRKKESWRKIPIYFLSIIVYFLITGFMYIGDAGPVGNIILLIMIFGFAAFANPINWIILFIFRLTIISGKKPRSKFRKLIKQNFTTTTTIIYILISHFLVYLIALYVPRHYSPCFYIKNNIVSSICSLGTGAIIQIIIFSIIFFWVINYHKKRKKYH